jgi:hypothetical protein
MEDNIIFLWRTVYSTANSLAGEPTFLSGIQCLFNILTATLHNSRRSHASTYNEDVQYRDDKVYM